MSDELVTFFKALADSSRLKIVGLLALHDHSVEELAALLHLKPPTISHHLSRLAEVGLVSARTQGYYSIYSLDRVALDAATRALLSTENITTSVGQVDMDGYQRKVLNDFSLPDGRLKEIPAQRRKLEVILHFIARNFESGRMYSERQVNIILLQFHNDTATLRRELVGYGLMERTADGQEYRLAQSSREG